MIVNTKANIMTETTMELQEIIGKYLLIYTVGGDVSYPTLLMLEDVVKVAGRVFVVGVQPEQIIGADNWLGNIGTHIAWDTVFTIPCFLKVWILLIKWLQSNQGKACLIFSKDNGLLKP